MSEEMTLSIGQVLQGRNASYRLLTALQTPTVFKAQILDSLAFKSDLLVLLKTVNISAYQHLVRWSKLH